MNKDISTSLATEIASRDRVRISFGGMDLELPNPDPVLKRLGKDITVYRDVMVDAIVKGAVRRRRSSVVGLEYGLEQGNASDRVYQLCADVLAKIQLRPLIRELHNAVWFGYAPAEVYWEKTPSNSLQSYKQAGGGQKGGLWLPTQVIGKPPEWFGFNHENRLCFKEMLSVATEPVPDMKFILARNDASFDNPYGVADLASVYWYTVFRKGGLKFWLRFADKFGQAYIIGKHPRGTPQKEVDLILDSLEVLAQDGVGAIPNDGSVEILESGGKGATSDMFERLLDHCGSGINIALLGQDQSTNASSTNASAKAGLEVTDDIRDADGECVAEAINQLLTYVVRLNIGDNEPMPVWRMWSEEDKTEALASRDMNLQKAGARLTKAYFMRAYKLAEDEVEVDAPLSATARSRGREPRERGGNQQNYANSGAMVDFSEGELTPSNSLPPLTPPYQGEDKKQGRELKTYEAVRLDYADANVAKLAKQSQPIIDDWLARIKATMDTATDINQLPDMIANEFSELPTDELVKVMEMALMAGELAGRAEVMAESD